MKKFLSVLLAIIMIFSVTTVAFAEEEPAPEEPTTEAVDEGFNIMDLPIWTVGAGFKLGKIVLKIATVLLKLADTFGLISIKDMLQDLINNIMNGDKTVEDETTTVAPDLTEAPAGA